MTAHPGSVTCLIDRIRSGERGEAEVAAAAIWKRYFPELLRVATGQLSPRIRRRVDGEDVLQDALNTFFLRHARGEFDLADRDDLWALLVQITRNKARKAATRQQSQKRDVRRERDADAGDDGDRPDLLFQQLDRSAPAPDDAVAVAEEMGRLLDGLDDQLREVALLKLQGHTHEEIADKLGCVVRTVERKVERIRAAWEGGAGLR
jgi:RNA polymerase sigma factor (sigma-70 family)